MPRGKQSKGTCTYCGAEIAKSGVIKHLSTCSKRQAIIEKAERKRTEHETLHHLRVQDAWRSEFWLNLEVRGSGTLKDLDAYLRHIWLECCGHLSRFSVGGWRGEEIPKNRKIGEVFQRGTELTQLRKKGGGPYATNTHVRTLTTTMVSLYA